MSLNAQNTGYLLIGGFAIGYHDYPRSTGDMELRIEGGAANAQKKSAALQEFGFIASNVPQEIFREPNAIFRIANPPLRVEPMTDISGVNFACRRSAREEAMFAI